MGLGRRVTSKSKQARSIRPLSRMSARSSLRHGESLARQESPRSQATSAIDRATSRRHPISSGAKELSSKLSDSRSAPSVRGCRSTALRPRTPSVVPTRGGVSPGDRGVLGWTTPTALRTAFRSRPRAEGNCSPRGGCSARSAVSRTSIRSASHLPASASTRRIAADTASSRLLGSVGPETDLGSTVIRPTEPAPRARESERVPR